MGGSGDDADRPSGQSGRGRRERGGVAADDEPGGRLVVGERKIDLRPKGVRRRDRGDDRIAFPGRQRVDQSIPWARLDRASDVERLADRARHIDVESAQRAVPQGEVQRRVIVGRQEADGAHAGQRRPSETKIRVDESWRRLRAERRASRSQTGERRDRNPSCTKKNCISLSSWHDKSQALCATGS